MGDLEERETISSRSRPAARSVAPAPIIEDHAQRSRIPRRPTSSWSKKSPSSSGAPPNWRRGNGVRRQLEYALASFIKEMKKGKGE
jgi:hypothetical protein